MPSKLAPGATRQFVHGSNWLYLTEVEPSAVHDRAKLWIGQHTVVLGTPEGFSALSRHDHDLAEILGPFGPEVTDRVMWAIRD